MQTILNPELLKN